jgi:hypothetical protein
MTAALLKDVLPVAGTPETVRQHLHRVAARQDAELGTRQRGLIDDGPAADQPLPVPREAIIVGSDGGYLRNWYDKRKKFEVIVGKSMAEDRDDRYFGLVRSQGDAPKLRFCEVLRAQGLPADQAVTVLAVTASARSSATCQPAPNITWTGSVRPEGCQDRPDSPQGSMRECVRPEGRRDHPIDPQGPMREYPVREPCPPKCCYPDMRRSNPPYKAPGTTGLIWEHHSGGGPAEDGRLNASERPWLRSV